MMEVGQSRQATSGRFAALWGLFLLMTLRVTSASHAQEAVPADAPWFRDESATVGIDFLHVRAQETRLWFPEIMSGGACWLDYDGDGDLDLYLVQGGELGDETRSSVGNVLYESRRDAKGEIRFADVTAQAGVGNRSYGMGCAVGDYDGDGDVDLYVTNVGANVLYENLSQETDRRKGFRDVTEAAGVGHPGWGTSAIFHDFDNDDDLDLFVVNYIHWAPEREIECFAGGNERDYCQPENYNAPAPDLLYRNDGLDDTGTVTFTDASATTGIAAAFGNGLGVASGDFDGDGRLDFYVTNDGDPNQLWLQETEGRFTDRALLSGSAVNGRGQAEAGMGVVAVDLDNNGLLDLFMTHLRGESNTLYLNRGGWFDDATAMGGLAAPSISRTGFGVGAADFDHDGNLDLFIANGRVGKSLAPLADDPFAEPDQLYRGVGDSARRVRFEEVSNAELLAQPLVETGRAVALADYDDDGDIDVMVVNNGGRARLLENLSGARGRSILFRLIGYPVEAIGARARVRVAGQDQWRWLQRGYGYLSSHDPRLHFGVGAAPEVDSVLVIWPNGRRESFGSLPAGQTHDLRYGTGKLEP